MRTWRTATMSGQMAETCCTAKPPWRLSGIGVAVQRLMRCRSSSSINADSDTLLVLMSTRVLEWLTKHACTGVWSSAGRGVGGCAGSIVEVGGNGRRTCSDTTEAINADVPNWREVVRERSGVPRAAACAATLKSGSQKRRRSQSGFRTCVGLFAWRAGQRGLRGGRGRSGQGGARSPSRGSARLRRRVGRHRRGETPEPGRALPSPYRRRRRSRQGKRFRTGCARAGRRPEGTD